jgi:hypothetical protein
LNSAADDGYLDAMNLKHGLFVLTLPVLGGCGLICAADEEHAVAAFSTGPLTVARNGGPAVPVDFDGRIHPEYVGESVFRPVFDAIEGRVTTGGFVVSMRGEDPVNGESLVLALAVPADLRKGAVYTVARTFTVQISHGEATAWGRRTLAVPQQAEIALSAATYAFPPGVYTHTFQAAAVAGTITVVNRWKETVELTLDLRTTDASGSAVVVRGNVYLNAQRYTPPCT